MPGAQALEQTLPTELSWSRRTLRTRTLELALSGALVLGGLSRLVVPVDDVAEGFSALTRPEEVLQVALACSPGEGVSSNGDASADS
jgi:hypothetical protein